MLFLVPGQRICFWIFRFVEDYGDMCDSGWFMERTCVRTNWDSHRRSFHGPSSVGGGRSFGENGSIIPIGSDWTSLSTCPQMLASVGRS